MTDNAWALAARPQRPLVERIGTLVLGSRPAVIALMLVLVTLAGAGIGKLGFKNDYRMFFSQENAELAAFERLQKTFNRNDNVLISVSARDGTLFTRERLQALAELSARAWHIPAARRVDSLATFQHSYAVGDEIVVEGLASRAAKFGDSDVARVREVALTDPLVVRRLVNPQGSVAGINVIVEMDDATKDAQVLEIAGQARALAREAAARYPDLQFHVTGAVMLDAAFHAALGLFHDEPGGTAALPFALERMDVFGPADVFYFANYVASTMGERRDPYVVELVAPEAGPVRTAIGPPVCATVSLTVRASISLTVFLAHAAGDAVVCTPAGLCRCIRSSEGQGNHACFDYGVHIVSLDSHSLVEFAVSASKKHRMLPLLAQLRCQSADDLKSPNKTEG